MPDAPKNPRPSAFLAVLLLVGAVLVWRAGKPPAPVESEPATAPPAIRAVSADATSGATARSPESSAAPEERHGPVKRDGLDAANLYADAFVLFNQLNDAEKAMIRKPSDEVDAEQAAKLFEKLQAIMALLRAAAKADYCDWGTGEITFETGLPHVTKANDLAQLALWAAGYRFSNDPAGAIDDLALRAKLGHHLSDTLVGALLAASIERGANGLLQQYAGSMDATTLHAATSFIGGSTLDADLTRAFRGEISGVESYGAKLASADPLERGRMMRTLNAGASGTSDWLEPVKEIATGLFASPQRIAEEVSFIRGVHEEAPDAMRLPETEFQSWWASVESAVQDVHPLAKLTLPSLSGVQASIQRLRVERTLLTAAADVLQNGPARIGLYRDPATGGALIHVPTPSGFELRSPYVAKGKPVTMSFTRP